MLINLYLGYQCETFHTFKIKLKNACKQFASKKQGFNLMDYKTVNSLITSLMFRIYYKISTSLPSK